LLAGPIFAREWLTAPRQLKHYLLRAGYVAVLIVLMYTAGHATFGFQAARNVGDVARFGRFLFSVFAVVQLSIVIASALLFGATNVAQEKDRRTLILLLMTDLRNRELVLGKLFAGLLAVAVLILVSLPVFCFVRMLGGVTLSQVLWLEALSAAAALAAGSWGSLVAFWREKTFQTLAIGVLGLALFIGLLEALRVLAGPGLAADIAGWLNPYRALGRLLDPLADPAVKSPTLSLWQSVLSLSLLAAALAGGTIVRLRDWNPSKWVYEAARKSDAARERKVHRAVWENAVIWREIRTRAYGRKIILIKLAYFVLAAGLLWSLYSSAAPQDALVLGMISREGFAFVVLALVAFLLVNAQAVTALTTERDGQTLELLLVTDITPQEFVFGKLGGVLYNSWQVLAVPVAVIIAGWARGTLTLENAVYVFLGFAVLVWFAAVLGLHSGLSYLSSRTAIANSLGTVFFLFVGIFICMMLIVEARSSFALQFPPFLVFILGGSLGLTASLTRRQPSPALRMCAFLLPFLTFYAITSFLLDNTLGVCLVVVVAYGFTTVAMLVPAVSEFDLALGRSTADRG
jgi:ABC-type transport system involved in multi-copper enzyme maturation permease subunit